ncbi:MAG TPA: sigma-70 family RNA polymerase sigma factor [Chloroflexota bacterium]|nr:sigma-70 family RNA polymerase sigma factor [Chloroflexota bacterium]
MLEDLELIERARRGDHAAYGQLVERYKDAIHRLAFRIVRHPSDAEDATQEAFVRAYVALDSYNPQYRFYTWLAAIAQHVCFRSLRSRDWRVVSFEPALVRAQRAHVEDGPEIGLLIRERDEVIRRLVDGLPDKYRQVLILRHWHELSYEEIARVTELSLAAVKTRLHRGRQMLATGLAAGRPQLEAI